MNSSELSEYYTYRRIVKWLLLCLGIFPLEHPSLLYRLLPFIHIILHLGTAFGIIGFVRINISNILVVTQRLGHLLSFFSVVLKLTCMVIYHEDIKALLTLDEYFDTLINNPRFTSNVTNGVTAVRRLSWAISSLVFMTCTLIIILPILYIIYQHNHHIQPVKYILPYHSIYPWIAKPNGILFKLHYIFEIAASYSLVAITSSVEPLFSLYVIQIIGQLREMSYRLIHLDESDDCDSIMRQCLLQYENLVKYRNTIQKIFGPIILWMMISNAVILCLAIFQISQLKTTSVGQAAGFVTYVLVKVVQTFVSGWAGTRLMNESEYYRATIYASNWQGNKKLMTATIIMLCQKPLTMTACNFSIISVGMLVSVLNTSLSYYFLLKTLQNDD